MTDRPDHEDHILVLTVKGDVKSVLMSDILMVKTVRPGLTCQIHHHTTLVGMGRTVRVLEVQESREGFLARSQALQRSLQLGDEQGITRHFAPPPTSKEP